MRLLHRAFLVLLASSVVAGLLALPVPAESSQPPKDNSETTQAKEQAKPSSRKKARGRLPAYFAKVVTQKQREDIYEIQARFSARIADLQSQIDQLIKDRDKEVEAVLSPDQLAEVKKLREEAKKRRMARRNKTRSSKQDSPQ